MSGCTHLDQVVITKLPASVDGCEECLREGNVWLHLRFCLTCGRVGCCDDSPRHHASAHAAADAHPLIRPLEPGEDWSYCYLDDVAMILSGVNGQTRLPPSPMMKA